MEVDCHCQTTDKQTFLSVLQNIFSKEATIGSSYNFGQYQLTIQEFSPVWGKKCSLFPLKSIILQKLSQCESIKSFQNKHIDSDNLDGTVEWTGCPLETSFDQLIHETETSSCLLNTSANSVKSRCLPITTARSLLSSYNIHYGGKKNEHILPLWIPCDLNNLEHVSWIGAFCTEDGNTRAIITSSGPLMGKSLPSLDEIKKKHLLGCTADFIKTSTEVFASYNFVDTLDVTQSSPLAQSGFIKSIPVSIQCFSDKPTPILKMLDEDAKCSIQLKINSGADRDSTNVICKDLDLIKILVSGIKNNEVIWPPKQPDFDMHVEIRAFMESQKYRRFQKASFKNLDSSSVCHLESSSLGRRQELDFTDELWNLLKRCSSCEELQDSLDYVVEMLKTGKVQPVIFPNNNTNIGKMARALQHGSSEIDLKEESSFDTLIEIGLEKLRRDFMYSFVEHELATQSQVSSFLRPNLPFIKCISQLTKLHNVLKIVSTCRNDLQLSSTTVKLFAREALTYYNELGSEDTEHVFNFSVPHSSVRKIINNLKASQWQISFKTETASYSLHTICCLSLTNPESSDQYHEDSDCLSPPFANSYYCTVARFIYETTEEEVSTRI